MLYFIGFNGSLIEGVCDLKSHHVRQMLPHFIVSLTWHQAVAGSGKGFHQEIYALQLEKWFPLWGERAHSLKLFCMYDKRFEI